jgi:biotin carboxylase
MVVVVRDFGVLWVAQTAETVRAAGCVIGLVTGPLEPGEAVELDKLFDGLAVVDDPTDPHQLADAARGLSRGHRLGALFSASDGTLVAAARAAELLGVGRTPASALALCRNKFAARRAMRDAGLSTPGFALLHDAEHAATVAAEVGLPAVIKPVNGAGSHLVERVHTVDELAAAYRKIADQLLDVPQLRNLYTTPLDTIDPSRSFLVETMLDGPEFTLDFVVRDDEVEVLPVVDKFLIDDRFFELGFVSPPLGLPAEREKLIIEHTAAAVRALGLDNVAGCVEVIDDEHAGPTVVEVNGRPGGQLLGTLYGLRTGVNTGAEVISLARGVPCPRDEPPLPIPLATLTVFPERTGRLRAVHGLDKVAELPDVIRVVPSVRPGDLVTTDYEMFAVNLVVAGFVDYADLVDVYQQATELVTFEIDPL